MSLAPFRVILFLLNSSKVFPGLWILFLLSLLLIPIKKIKIETKVDL